MYNENTQTPTPGSTIGIPRVCINNLSLNEPKGQSKRTGIPAAPPESLKSFPIWGLPEDLRMVIKDVADGYQCSPDIVAAGIFSAAGTALGKQVIGHFDNFFNYPCCWFVIVGPASTGKTAPIEWVYQPLQEQERIEFNNYLSEREKWEATPRDLKGEPPVLRSRIAGNITDEKLLRKLADNDGYLCCKHDELASFFGGMGRYSNGGAGMIIANLLSIFSHVDFQIERISSGAARVTRPAMNIISSSQPIVLKKLFKPFIASRNGFFERFLFVNVGNDIPAYKQTIIADNTKRIWQEYIDRLIRTESCDLFETEAAHDYHVQAINRWRGNARALADGMMDEDSGDDIIASIYEKANYHVCRLSIIAAMLNGESVISPCAISYAIDVTDYLINQQIATLIKILEAEKLKASRVTMKMVVPYLMEKYGKTESDIAKWLNVERQTIHGYRK